MSLVSQRYEGFVIHTLGSAVAILIVVVLVQEGVEWLVCGVCVGGGFAVWQGRVRAFYSRVESRVKRSVLFASRSAGSLEDEANDNSSE
jgi:hypothetical protein